MTEKRVALILKEFAQKKKFKDAKICDQREGEVVARLEWIDPRSLPAVLKGENKVFKQHHTQREISIVDCQNYIIIWLTSVLRSLPTSLHGEYKRGNAVLNKLMPGLSLPEPYNYEIIECKTPLCQMSEKNFKQLLEETYQGVNKLDKKPECFQIGGGQ